MLGFDPHGIYGHPDHLVTHRAVTAAFHSSGCTGVPVQRLFYTAHTVSEMRRLQGQRGLGVFAGLAPERYAVSECTVGARVDVRRYAERKRRALFAHRTQTGPQSTLGTLEETSVAPLYEEETFSIGGLRGPVTRYPLSGLFDGLPAARHLRQP